MEDVVCTDTCDQLQLSFNTSSRRMCVVHVVVARRRHFIFIGSNADTVTAAANSSAFNLSCYRRGELGVAFVRRVARVPLRDPVARDVGLVGEVAGSAPLDGAVPLPE